MSTTKNYFVNAQTIIVIVAILAWGWMTFFHDKMFPEEASPRAEISHEIFSTCLNNQHRLVRVGAAVRNIGAGPLKLSASNHSIAQVSPPPTEQDLASVERDVGIAGSKPGLIVWPEFFEGPGNSLDIVLQPGELHEEFHDFVIAPSAKVVEVKSYFANDVQNQKDERMNWEETLKTIYDAGAAACR
ncbi:MAG: hypothetical protein HKN35_07065 [Woeseia sp.]|nr:hypothetical protein [Woeseia sp.]MBT8096178.1 hypothetical protein [Woeseia sp.]NNE60635.1 hypothetical protein [Woeseia sp.]